jgi:hypothetical protein
MDKLQKTVGALKSGHVFWRGQKAGKPTNGWTAEKGGSQHFRVSTATLNSAVFILNREGFAITQDAWRILISPTGE